MAFLMEFDARNNVLRLTIDGPLNDAIMVEIFKAAGGYASSHPPCRSIADLSKVTVNDVSSDSIRQMAKTAVLAPEVTRVVVAPKDHSFAIARMFQIYSEETRPNFHVVHTMDEAYRLLGVVSPEFSPVTME